LLEEMNRDTEELPAIIGELEESMAIIDVNQYDNGFLPVTCTNVAQQQTTNCSEQPEEGFRRFKRRS
jgi:hypothetical protein